MMNGNFVAQPSVEQNGACAKKDDQAIELAEVDGISQIIQDFVIDDEWLEVPEEEVRHAHLLREKLKKLGYYRPFSIDDLDDFGQREQICKALVMACCERMSRTDLDALAKVAKMMLVERKDNFFDRPANHVDYLYMEWEAKQIQ